MDTKQFLYNTLNAQLDIKKSECEKYDNEVYQPSLNELITKVNRWFVDNTKGTYESFSFTGHEIEIITSNIDRYDYKIRLSCRTDFRNAKHNQLKLNVNYQSSVMNGDNTDDILNHLKILNGIASKYSTISDLFINDWVVKYNELTSNRNKFQEDTRTLESALNTLKYEIRDDKIAAMLEMGYELNSFKNLLQCTYENELIERKKSIQLQYGRSQYDTTYVGGFKVLDKKGNKYKVAVYFEDGRQREYDVLEKKFKDFIERAYDWESYQADENNKKETKRHQERLKLRTA